MIRRGLSKRESARSETRLPLSDELHLLEGGRTFDGRATSGTGRSGSARRRVLRFELLSQRRVLASITGQVFHDLDDSLRKDEVEVGLANRVLYLDLDNNSEVTAGEPFAITDEDGQFAFDDLATGDYVVRLFNGTPTQLQTAPFVGERVETPVPVSDPFSSGQRPLTHFVGDRGLFSYTAAGNRLTEVNLESFDTRWLDLPGEIADLQSIDGGELLALVKPAEGAVGGFVPSVVLVDFDTGTFTSLQDETVGGISHWGQMAIGVEGKGLVTPLAEAGSSVPLHAVQYDALTTEWTTEVLSLHVDSSTTLWGDKEWPVILVSQPSGVGTQVAMWSVISESVIPGSEASLGGVGEVVAFDYPSGLLVVRTGDGELQVRDSANAYATLHSIEDFQGPVALDGHRELLFGLLNEFELGIFDIREGKFLPDVMLEMPIGSAAGIALSDGGDRVAIRRPGYVSQVRIDRPGQHLVSLSSDTATKDILFGLEVSGENLPPIFTEEPQFRIGEDSSLVLNAPGLLSLISNSEDDELVALQVSEASHGNAIIRPDGSVLYTPLPNYFGFDSFDVQVSDGRDITDVVTVSIEIWPEDDLPLGINILIPNFPENIQGPAIIGTIDVDEVDGDQYLILLSDERFDVDGTDVIVVAGAEFDHESEPMIELTITAINPDNDRDSAIVAAVINVDDVDEAPTEIYPDSVEVGENLPGEIIADVVIDDPDSTEGYKILVADERFVVEGTQIRLRDGVALDHESGATLSVPVSIVNAEGQTLLSQSLEVNVIDANDEITDIVLSGSVLPERASAYAVGVLSAIDQDRNQIHQFSVDDSRFEVVDSVLKLRDGVYVRRIDQAEIELMVTANDGSGSVFSKAFVLSVLENEAPHHNNGTPTDVDGDGRTGPLDAIIIINHLNRTGPAILDGPMPYELGRPRFVDVNGDGQITPLDALIIINHLNRHGAGSAEPTGGGGSTGEGESTEPSASPMTPLPTQRSVPLSPWDTWDEDEDDDEVSLF